MLYEHEAQEVWSARAMLAVQGLPVADLEEQLGSVSEADIANMAGEGFFLPNACAILLAIMLNSHGPWFRS
jgi:hypothetical protein